MRACVRWRMSARLPSSVICSGSHVADDGLCQLPPEDAEYITLRCLLFDLAKKNPIASLRFGLVRRERLFSCSCNPLFYIIFVFILFRGSLGLRDLSVYALIIVSFEDLLVLAVLCVSHFVPVLGLFPIIYYSICFN